MSQTMINISKTAERCVPLVGCALLVLGSLVRIPFYPVPFTLQTFALFLIGLSMSPKEALASTLYYLLLGTLGFPVFGGKVNPYWLMGKCGGYLLAYPIGAYLIAKLRTRFSSFWALFCGGGLVLLLGFVWLIPFIGVKAAWMHGALFFIPIEFCKGALALALTRWVKR